MASVGSTTSPSARARASSAQTSGFSQTDEEILKYAHGKSCDKNLVLKDANCFKANGGVACSSAG